MQTRGPQVAFDSNHGVGVPLRHEVQFKDGTAVWLHRVTRHGAPDLFLRSFATDGTAMQPAAERTFAAAAGVLQIDLRRLAPELQEDLPRASTRDVPGTVMYALREHFKSGGEFLRAARELAA